MARRRGFLLILVLLLGVMLLTMGLGFLGSRVGQYQSTTQAVLSVRARQLARCGLEDARTKLNRDIRFPPQVGAGQEGFTYSEDYSDCAGVLVGCYQVNLNSTYSSPPYQLLCITSTGLLGPRTNPTASHTYRIYLDIDPASATYYQIIRWEDLGVP